MTRRGSGGTSETLSRSGTQWTRLHASRTMRARYIRPGSRRWRAGSAALLVYIAWRGRGAWNGLSLQRSFAERAGSVRRWRTPTAVDWIVRSASELGGTEPAALGWLPGEFRPFIVTLVTESGMSTYL